MKWENCINRLLWIQMSCQETAAQWNLYVLKSLSWTLTRYNSSYICDGETRKLSWATSVQRSQIIATQPMLYGWCCAGDGQSYVKWNDCSLTTHSENILFSHFISEFMHLLFLYWRLALRQISNEVIWRAYILFFLIALAAETTGAVTLIRVYHLLLYKVALQDRMGGGLAG